MTNTVLIKRSGTANSVPTAGQLNLGELAINYTDGNLFYKTNGGSVTTIASNKFVSVTGNITGANLNAVGLSLSGNVISALNVTGNVAGNYFIGNGSLLTGVVLSNSDPIVTTGNVTGGNLLTVGLISATGNVTGNYFVGNANVQYTASTSPPASGNLIGAQWYDTSTSTLYEYQSDGTTLYWVDITGPVIGSNGAVAGSAINNGTSNVTVTANANTTIGVAGTTILTVASTGAIVTGSLTTSGAVISNYNTNAANTASFSATGGNTKGGTGYLDFLVARNTSGGATNPYKWLRVNSTGGLEIVNSAYDSVIFSLTDTGGLSVLGPVSVSGKQAVNGPAFRVYVDTGQAISSGSQQKVTFGSETFDTNSNFASSRFTPTVEGYYQLNATVRIDGPASTGECMIVLYKNGAEYARGNNESGTEQGASFYSMQVSDIAYANGTGDYFEVYIQQTSGGNKNTTAGAPISYFSGSMIRGA